jgi:hypothetical protein
MSWRGFGHGAHYRRIPDSRLINGGAIHLNTASTRPPLVQGSGMLLVSGLLCIAVLTNPSKSRLFGPEMFRRNQAHVSLLAQAVASFGVVLVLALTVLAASPDLHRMLHGHEEQPATAAGTGGHGQPADDGDEGCVVTLFAQGIVLPLAAFALAFAGRILRLINFDRDDRVFAVAPGFLHLPSQGPPVE